MAILKQRVVYNYPPESFKCLEISLPSSFHTINDEHVRSRLCERYRRTIQQSKANMLALLVTIAEVQMHQAQKEFDQQMDQHKSEAMIKLIDQRLSNIMKRMQCIYNYQVHFFVQAPTAVNTSM